jgi:hypothetical protein
MLQVGGVLVHEFKLLCVGVGGWALLLLRGKGGMKTSAYLVVYTSNRQGNTRTCMLVYALLVTTPLDPSLLSFCPFAAAAAADSCPPDLLLLLLTPCSCLRMWQWSRTVP